MIHDLEWYFSRVNRSLELKEFGSGDEIIVAEGIAHHFQTEDASAMENVIILSSLYLTLPITYIVCTNNS